MSGAPAPAVVFGFAALSNEALPDIGSDKHSAARVAAASKQLRSSEGEPASGAGATSMAAAFGDQQPDSIRGKPFADLKQVAADVMAALGKHPKRDSLVFEEFKTALEGLEIRFNDAQAWSWFVEGDLDAGGRIELEELQYILYIVSLLQPRRKAMVKDAFFMFAKPLQPAGRAAKGHVPSTPSQRKDPGVVDLVGALEATRALGVQAKQSAIEHAFTVEDPLGSLSLSYP